MNRDIDLTDKHDFRERKNMSHVALGVLMNKPWGLEDIELQLTDNIPWRPLDRMIEDTCDRCGAELQYIPWYKHSRALCRTLCADCAQEMELAYDMYVKPLLDIHEGDIHPDSYHEVFLSEYMDERRRGSG